MTLKIPRKTFRISRRRFLSTAAATGVGLVASPYLSRAADRPAVTHGVQSGDVGAQKGTAFIEPLQKTGLFTDVKIYDTIPAILSDVNTGRLKAGFADKPILAYNLKQGLFPEVRLVNSYVSTIVGSVGIGVRKSDGELLAKINASLDKLTKDGTLKKILAKWGLD